MEHCDSCWEDAAMCNQCREGYGLDNTTAACQPCPEGCRDCSVAIGSCLFDSCLEGYEIEDFSAAILVCVPLKA